MTDQPIPAAPPTTIVRETALADCYTTLVLLLQFPDKAWFERLSDESLQNDVRAIATELALGGPSIERSLSELNELASGLVVRSSSLSDARREYTRLFNHPDHPAIPLFEGVFLDTELVREDKPATGSRLFINPAALDAERCYRQAGLKRTSNANIPADCISTELAFLAHLHNQYACALRDKNEKRCVEIIDHIVEFDRIHVSKWFARFFERCIDESLHPLYRAVGYLGSALVAQPC